MDIEDEKLKAYQDTYAALQNINQTLLRIMPDSEVANKFVRNLMAQVYLLAELDLGYKPDLRGYGDD